MIHLFYKLKVKLKGSYFIPIPFELMPAIFLIGYFLHNLARHFPPFTRSMRINSILLNAWSCFLSLKPCEHSCRHTFTSTVRQVKLLRDSFSSDLKYFYDHLFHIIPTTYSSTYVYMIYLGMIVYLPKCKANTYVCTYLRKMSMSMQCDATCH